MIINTNDQISKLPNDVLVKILGRMTMVDAVRTSVLARRWENVWKETSHLSLDMRWIARARSLLSDVTPEAAKSVTKVIKDHRGNLESFTLFHEPCQYEQGMFEAWIQSLIHEKLTKHLMLVNCRSEQNTKQNIPLNLPPKSFSHPNLHSLMLSQYDLETPHAFNSCWNIKTLKLIGISAEIEVFNVVLVSCVSLEALVLKISCHKRSGILKIENRKLKFLHLSCSDQIDGLEVSSPGVDIFSIESLSSDVDKVVIANPRIKFSRNYWTTGTNFPHISYNISCPDQEEKSVGHEFMMSRPSDYMKRFGSMSVSVDLTNTKEVEMLKDVLVAWPVEMVELEIKFKNNSTPQNEGESSIGGTWKKFWEGTKPFPNANFRAYNIWLINFSGSKEEFAFASRLITQGTVARTMVIKLSPVSPTKKSELKAAVARLKELPKGHRELGILVS
ncbi:unnamed protein product [Arabis nemorensis]|uniref:F-box domain-containing protein n=1 Tax=Arabis nemorensis TaxID=586526 RepID=A0A565B3T3_9BRAS|nr:unnamed protein product [Arabis nemorensis]